MQRSIVRIVGFFSKTLDDKSVRFGVTAITSLQTLVRFHYVLLCVDVINIFLAYVYGSMDYFQFFGRFVWRTRKNSYSFKFMLCTHFLQQNRFHQQPYSQSTSLKHLHRTLQIRVSSCTNTRQIYLQSSWCAGTWNSTPAKRNLKLWHVSSTISYQMVELNVPLYSFFGLFQNRYYPETLPIYIINLSSL